MLKMMDILRHKPIASMQTSFLMDWQKCFRGLLNSELSILASGFCLVTSGILFRVFRVSCGEQPQARLVRIRRECHGADG